MPPQASKHDLIDAEAGTRMTVTVAYNHLSHRRLRRFLFGASEELPLTVLSIVLPAAEALEENE